MPSPRSGTVTTYVTTAVREFKADKIQFRGPKGASSRCPSANCRSPQEQLTDNIEAILT